jgi:protein-tyrosine phosphatase
LQRNSEARPNEIAQRVEPKNQILFLCTWNYYRSRFAEIYFNWEAAAAKLDWQADSRGLALPESIPNTISLYTVDYLARLAIPYDRLRKPMAATDEDFAKANRVIAIKRAEHHPIVQKRFETFADRVEYWDIHDIDASTPEEQLPLLHAQVRSLVTELAYA